MVPIKDYAVIGNCRAAALVSRSGSIDWLCWPRFDSGSWLGRLLDDKAGVWSFAPSGPCKIERQYEPDTNVLRTTFRSATGIVRLTDLMPVLSEEDKHRHLTPDHEILRIMECQEGEVAGEMVLEPRPDYARAPA